MNPISMPVHYSYVSVRSDELGQNKIVVDGHLMRTEKVRDGVTTIKIFRPDRDRVYTIRPAEKTYYETIIPGFASEGAPGQGIDQSDRYWEYVGEEDIEGVKCKKYIVHSKSFGKIMGYEWIINETQMSRRHATVNRMGEIALIVDHLEIDLSKPNPLLFEIPPGYQLVDG